MKTSNKKPLANEQRANQSLARLGLEEVKEEGQEKDFKNGIIVILVVLAFFGMIWFSLTHTVIGNDEMYQCQRLLNDWHQNN